jgi:hypothetical protein
VRHFSQHSYNVPINSHDGQLTLHNNSHAPGSVAVWWEGRTVLGVQSNVSISETFWNRTRVHNTFFA